MEWREAIITVLKESDGPVQYREIADVIADRRYRLPEELGATPANTVNAIIGNSLRDEGDRSPFVRPARGLYTLREVQQRAAGSVAQEIIEEEESPEAGVVNALGMFWERSKVLWETSPHLYGKQQTESQPVDFAGQIGVYLLHDPQGVVYAGRTTDQNLGKRLYQHTVDRLNGRWDRFSWFGIYPVQSDGTLKTEADFSRVPVDVVIATMEAVLIEGLEPRQNRRRGDDFQAVEFLQSEDPQLEIERKLSLVQEIAAELKGRR